MSKKIDWKCPNCWTTYEIDEKFADALKNKQDCKFCVRKDPNVPTTAEMDGLKTPEEMRERWDVVLQCLQCLKWTQQKLGEKNTPCTAIIRGKEYIDGRNKVVAGCGSVNYDHSSMKSVRSYNRDSDNKRKPNVKARKK